MLDPVHRYCEIPEEVRRAALINPLVQRMAHDYAVGNIATLEDCLAKMVVVLADRHEELMNIACRPVYSRTYSETRLAFETLLASNAPSQESIPAAVAPTVAFHQETSIELSSIAVFSCQSGAYTRPQK